MATPAERPTLFEHAGGMPAMLRLAEAHHARCLADPVLNHPFSHDDLNPEHVGRLAAYWAEVLGGPPAYSRSLGGDQSGLLDMHAHNGPMDDLGERFIVCFDAAADDAGLPDDADFRTALHDYMSWAVADVLVVAPYDAEVPVDASMPHWSWDGLVA